MRIRRRQPAFLLSSPPPAIPDLSREREKELEDKHSWSSPTEGGAAIEMQDVGKRAEQLGRIEDLKLESGRPQVVNRQLTESNYSHPPYVNGSSRTHLLTLPINSNEGTKIINCKNLLVYGLNGQDSSGAPPPPANNEANGCNEEGRKRGRGGGAFLMEGSRCSRVNGRGWRCSQATLVGYCLCEHHLGKGRLRCMTTLKKHEKKKKTTSVGIVKARSITSLLGGNGFSSDPHAHAAPPRANFWRPHPGLQDDLHGERK